MIQLDKMENNNYTTQIDIDQSCMIIMSRRENGLCYLIDLKI